MIVVGYISLWVSLDEPLIALWPFVAELRKDNLFCYHLFGKASRAADCFYILHEELQY